MPRTKVFIAVTAAAICLAGFVTLEYTFKDAFPRSLSSDVADMLAALWGGEVSFLFQIATLAVIYALVAALGGILAIVTYRLLKGILSFLARRT